MTPQPEQETDAPLWRQMGQRLRAARLRMNLSQETLAERVGTSVRSVRRWERGEALPHPYARAQLCSVLGQTSEALGVLAPLPAAFEEHTASLSGFSLPLPLTALIGREREVSEVAPLLSRAPSRLVTFTGPGGVGKTHLALHLATQFQACFPDGVCCVSLASLPDAAQVLPTIAQALHQPASGTRAALDHLKTVLRHQQILLVLDNAEHVLGAAGSLVDLLRACPSLRLLVTSREALHVRGERIFPVSPLALPAPHDRTDPHAVAQASAITLFLERARDIDPALAVTPETAPLLSAICQRLDGLPLALELAASRLRLLSLPDLLARLESPLALLNRGPRDLPGRQQTLRATIGWSYDLLSAPEQRLFRLCSVFAGGWTLHALSALADPSIEDDSTLLDLVESLAEKHLLVQRRTGQQPPRLMMLETIREFAREELVHQGEAELVRQAHARYYLHLAEHPETLPSLSHWLDLLEREQDNLRAALSWGLHTPAGTDKGQPVQTALALRLSSALMLFWGERGSISEGRQWVEQALRAGATGGPVPAVVSANAHECAGWLALLQNDIEQATRQYHQALPLYQKAGIPGGRSWSLLWLGWCALRTGKREEASRLLEQSRGVFDQEEAKGPTPPFHLSVIPLFLAVIATDSQDYPEAQSLLDRSLALAYQENSQEHVAWVRRYQGRLALAQGEQELACVRFEESLALSRTQINRVGIAHSLYGLGLGALLRGDLLGARKLLSESLVVFQQPGMQPANTALVRGHLASIATLQGEEASADAWYHESLTWLGEEDDREALAWGLKGWGRLAARQGEGKEAAYRWGAAEALEERGPRPRNPFLLPVISTDMERAETEQMRHLVQHQLGMEAFARAWAEGRTMTVEHLLSQYRRAGVRNEAS